MTLSRPAAREVQQPLLQGASSATVPLGPAPEHADLTDEGRHGLDGRPRSGRPEPRAAVRRHLWRGRCPNRGGGSPPVRKPYRWRPGRRRPQDGGRSFEGAGHGEGRQFVGQSGVELGAEVGALCGPEGRTLSSAEAPWRSITVMWLPRPVGHEVGRRSHWCTASEGPIARHRSSRHPLADLGLGGGRARSRRSWCHLLRVATARPGDRLSASPRPRGTPHATSS